MTGMPEETSKASVSIDGWIDMLCDQFEAAWKADERPAIKYYLDRCDQEQRSTLLRELLHLELEYRRRKGERISKQEYASTFSQHGEVVAEVFQRLAAGDSQNNPKPDSTHPLRIGATQGDYQHREDLLTEAGEPELDKRVWPSQAVLSAARRSTQRSLEVRCPQCGQPNGVNLENEPRRIACQACHNVFTLAVDQFPDAKMTLGRFDLLQRLGSGAFGVVWKAYDSQLKRLVALKFPRYDDLSTEEIERFLREGQAAAQLEHDNIVTIYDVCTVEDTPILVTKFIDGPSLDRRLEKTKMLTCEEAARLGVQLADALDHAHRAGVVHRDLKPANILMDDEGKAYITDFGLAKRKTDQVTMTLEGQLLGTPAYMSPEQAEGKHRQSDHRTDIYSLGAILFELSTGERPFRGTLPMLLDQAINDPPPSPRKLNANVPRDLEVITLKCLHKTPADRYPNAAEVRDELQRFLDGRPIVARPPTPLQTFLRWYPKHASMMLGAYYIVSPLTWVFFIIGGFFRPRPQGSLHLASPVFLFWALAWIGLGYAILKKGFWWELANVPMIIAFALLPFFSQNDGQSIMIIVLISGIGIVLQSGALAVRIRNYRARPMTDLDIY